MAQIHGAEQIGCEEKQATNWEKAQLVLPCS
jgi:hypothetical protein